MTATLASTKADLVAEITAALVAASLTDVAVLSYEPAAVPRGQTVTVCTAQMLPTDYLFAIRIYASMNDPKTVQDALDVLIPVLDHGLSGTYGPVEWEVSLDVVDTGDVALATASVTAPREDF